MLDCLLHHYSIHLQLPQDICNLKKKILLDCTFDNLIVQLGLVADPVIEAIVRLEFVDGLRTVVFPGGYWYPCSSRT